MPVEITEQNFTEEVLSSSRPVLVNFWAPWCGLCRMINPILTSLESDMGGMLTLVDVNADENLKLASTYRLSTLPTLLLFDGGTLIHRIDSFNGRDDLRTRLSQVMEKLVTYSV